jgi:DNA-binding transcriptional MerR regulator
VVAVTTTERLTTLIDRAETDGLPELGDVLACAVNVDHVADLPLTVGQAAELLGLSGHTLRYYERIGLVTVDRNTSGQRRYDRAALGRVVFITRLRMSGMSIRDISDYIALVKQGDSTVDQRLKLLYAHRAKIRAQMEDLRFAMAVVDYKITTYGGHCSD